MKYSILLLGIIAVICLIIAGCVPATVEPEPLRGHLRTLTGHTGSVLSVVFSPDGRTLASGSLDSTVLLWDLTPAAPEPKRGHQP